ncbi:MAG: hypothetical protein IJ668_07080 [Selenomonadaceae bacterium]|nr:hypothetical protein [Selenomonadaceae bacterium]
MKVAVVIPIYKPLRADLDWYEIISLERCVEVLGHYPIRFIAPDDREFDYLPSTVDCKVETFDPIWFSNIHGYNALMLRPDFYERFLDYDYILIYQLDAFVFSDRLLEFCALGYDYIGASWPLGIGRENKISLNVGNGGFFLRRPKSCLNVLKNNLDEVKALRLAEDFVFAYLGKMHPDQFDIAPVRTASRFSVEYLPERYCRRNGNVLPFGCHAWHNFSASFYVGLFEELGIDLAPYAHLMKSKDLKMRDNTLGSLLRWRLFDRFRRGYPMMKYLPPGEPFYVFAADGQEAQLIQRLYDEGLPIVNGDNIPFLDSDEQIRAVAEVLRLIDVRGLLVSGKDDSDAVSKLIEYGGLKYGREFISYWREATRWSAALLRKISRPTINRKK